MSPWPSVSLGSLISTIRGGTSYGGESRQPATGEVGILTLGAVGGDRLDPDACKALPSAMLPQLGDSVRAGTLLMARSNTIDLVGSVVFVDADYSDRFLPDLLWELSLHTDAPLRPAFLADFLSTADGRRLLQSAAMGTSGSMKKLSMARLKRLEVPSVPLALQDAWLNVRNQIDRLQVHGRDLLTAKRAFKRALMNDLLTGRRRFPGGTSHAWRPTTLGAIAETSPARAGRQALPVLSCTKHTGLVLSDEYFGRRVYSQDLSNYRMVRHGELAYATNHLEEGSIGLLEDRPAGLISPMYTVLRVTDSEVEPRFLLALLKSEPFIDRFKRLTSGSVNRRGALRWSTLRSLEIRLPPLAEQRSIMEISTVADADIRAHSGMKDNLALLKRGLMQRLLSGEIEIPRHLTAATLAAEATDDDS